MSFSPEMAARRFGYGLSPRVAPPASADEMLSLLRGADVARTAFPLPDFRHLQDALVLRRRFAVYARDHPDTEKGKQAHEKSRDILQQMRKEASGWFLQVQRRRIESADAFRERLVAFWADHFTALGKGGLLRLAAPLYAEEAIRPQITSSFAELLTASVSHPLMLHYLDQNSSAGPNSRAAKRRQRGLNENLAREILELHTLGVGASYTQTDVRELAKLLTGMAASRDYSFKFRTGLAEPGSEIVLGKTYAAKGGMAPIRAALSDLARHPATARHIAQKLAVHFIADTPPPEVVSDIEAAYLRTDGQLLACYEALLAHPMSWSMPAGNMRPPDEFLSAALRALAPTPAALDGLTQKEQRDMFLRPLRLMGQDWMHPAGPDGFDEADGAWITPQGIAARLEWAMNAPARLLDALPDPAEFTKTALGRDVPPVVAFAASAAEDRRAAIGLILTSPAFQRR